MSENDAIRIMIVDDHAVGRSGLAAFLLAATSRTLSAAQEYDAVYGDGANTITLATGSPGAVYPLLRNSILEHGGVMETVSDEEAFRAMHVMAKMDGLSMEPAAAMACAPGSGH